MENKIPDLAQLMQYDVNRRGQYEGIRQSLYDFTTYAAGGQTSLQFFQQPKGQNGKTVADTNMSSAGQLPQPQHFLVESIELVFLPGSELRQVGDIIGDPIAASFSDDVYALAKGGSLDLFIGSKSYLQEAPLGRFPPKTRMQVDASNSYQVKQGSASNEKAYILTEYAVCSGRPYYLDPPVLLVPNQNFDITLSWPTAVALPSGANARIGVILDGILYRQSQ